MYDRVERRGANTYGIGRRVERVGEGATSNVHKGDTEAKARGEFLFPILSRANASPLPHGASFSRRFSYFRKRNF